MYDFATALIGKTTKLAVNYLSGESVRPGN
jgi:hypothetical protein